MVRFVRPVIAFFALGLYKKMRPQKEPLKLKLDEHSLHRYVICLIHLLHQNDREVHVQLCMTQSLLNGLHLGRNWKPYEALLLRHPSVSFCFSQKGAIFLSSDYFSELAHSPESYRIPIGTHPLFERRQVAFQPELKKRIFWTGNHTSEYTQQFDTNLWNMPERGETLRYLKQHCPDVILPKTSPANFCSLLSYADFFICLPGMFMPLCHTLYEAISYQTIPVCHTHYLSEVDSDLRAILSPYSWNTHSELIQLIQHLQQSAPNELEKQTKANLLRYLKTSLTSGFIESRIRNSRHVFICAEEKSIASKTT